MNLSKLFEIQATLGKRILQKNQIDHQRQELAYSEFKKSQVTIDEVIEKEILVAG